MFMSGLLSEKELMSSSESFFNLMIQYIESYLSYPCFIIIRTFAKLPLTYSLVASLPGFGPHACK